MFNNCLLIIMVLNVIKLFNLYNEDKQENLPRSDATQNN